MIVSTDPKPANPGSNRNDDRSRLGIGTPTQIGPHTPFLSNARNDDSPGSLSFRNVRPRHFRIKARRPIRDQEFSAGQRRSRIGIYDTRRQIGGFAPKGLKDFTFEIL